VWITITRLRIENRIIPVVYVKPLSGVYHSFINRKKMNNTQKPVGIAEIIIVSSPPKIRVAALDFVINGTMSFTEK